MWIKICGLNDPAIAREIAGLRPDAIGLNFYKPSVRSVSLETARAIVNDLPPEVDAIGVFVDSATDEMRQAIESCRLRGVQFHSARLDDSLDELVGTGRSDARDQRTKKTSLRRVRAFQIGARGLAPLEEYVARSRGRTLPVDAFLVDAQVEGAYGGTGKRAPWELVRREYQTENWPPLILAGGLRPENVAEAIDAVRPWGVDVASGVESSPGVKDVELVTRFIDEARRGFARF